MTTTKLNFEDFIEECKALRSETKLKEIKLTPVIEFSNTGRRGNGKKYFVITVRALIQTLEDIKNNLDSFNSHSSYDEGKWRDLGSSHFKDQATNALSTVQTLPLFHLLAKVIHIANALPQEQYRDGYINLNRGYIEKAIEYLSSEIPDSETLSIAISQEKIKSHESGGENRIYYGAPGTGKSYAISQVIDESKTTRIVFHADTQYSDFVGCLKPTKVDGELTYAFRPGPFVTALIQALKDPTVHYWLVIEEINRASAAAVFGEIFQMLDREDSGESTYAISPSDPDMISYIESELASKLHNGQISIPSNLSLLATMNSSDQAVMPLDTAFKRRWKFQYIPLNFTHCAVGEFSFQTESAEILKVSWSTFAKTINILLSELDIPEDRHLGPFFLSDQEMKNVESAKEALVGKLFLYLWDDVLRHGFRSDLFNSSIKSYGRLVESYTNGEQIFSERFVSLLESADIYTTNLADIEESSSGH